MSNTIKNQAAPLPPHVTVGEVAPLHQLPLADRSLLREVSKADEVLPDQASHGIGGYTALSISITVICILLSLAAWSIAKMMVIGSCPDLEDKQMYATAKTVFMLATLLGSLSSGAGERLQLARRRPTDGVVAYPMLEAILGLLAYSMAILFFFTLFNLTLPTITCSKF